MADKLISVIIPVRNGMNYLGQAIDSLQGQGVEVEIIVVDDGSTDSTAAYALERGCTVLSHQQSRGQVASKNTGIAAAKGQYIMFLDHDDVVRDGSLKVLRDVLDNDPQIAAVQAKVKDFRSPDVESLQGTLIRPDAYWGLFTGAVLIRKSALDAIGPFPDSVHTGEIIFWQTEFDARALKIQKIDYVSCDRRLHNTNFGKTDANKEYKDYASALRERLKSLRK